MGADLSRQARQLPAGGPKVIHAELEASLQQFGEFLLKAQLVKEQAAPYCVR